MRKAIKLRRAIQTAALRLFETQGYEHTTVEQIVEAAETSTTTFYRYFPTKEDVVLDNDASPLFEAAAATRPDGEPLTATIRAAMAGIVATAEADHDITLARMRLIATVPALEARYAGEERRSIDFLARLLANRTGRLRARRRPVHRLPPMGSRTRRYPARHPGRAGPHHRRTPPGRPRPPLMPESHPGKPARASVLVRTGHLFQADVMRAPVHTETGIPA